MRRALAPLVVIAFAQLLLAGDCVDGVTPDCSDPAARCGPNVDGSILDTGASPDGAGNDAASDAPPDAAADANDSGGDAADASDADDQ